MPLPNRSKRAADALLGLLVILLAAAAPNVGAAATPDPASWVMQQQLQLEVLINGQPTRFISAFVMGADGRLSSPRSELVELGIKVPGNGADAELIALDRVPGLSYAYDEPHQRIDIKAADQARTPKAYDGRGSIDERHAAQADWGGVLNYSLYGSGNADRILARPTFQGANAGFEGRFITPYGVMSQTGIVGSTVSDASNFTRLDSTFTTTDPDSLRQMKFGDFISGSLNWTRSVRLGGVQASRDFAVRPDLVTKALPVLSGTAAVPSTVDVYVNNIKSYTQQVEAGPFQLTNLPSISGAGTARLVVRDQAGHETEETVAFFTSAQLLKQGITDYSLEGGAPRVDYGRPQSAYVETPVASGSLRTGVFDWLTLEGHAEGGAGLINAGAGAVVRAGGLGVVSIAGAASHTASDQGLQLYGSLDTRLGPVSLHAQSQRTFGAYNDLASVTGTFNTLTTTSFLTGTALNLAPPREIDGVSLGVPLTFDKGSLSLGAVRIVTDDQPTTTIATLGYSRPILDNASLFATAYKDLNKPNSTGVYVGVSMPLGGKLSGQLGATSTAQGPSFGAGVTKSMDLEPNSWGFQVYDSEGAYTARNAGLSYRSQYATLGGAVQQSGSSVHTIGQVDGAVAIMRGGIFASNHISDGFAVVDAGAPGVTVMRQNQAIGQTNAWGRMLVPDLASYQQNKLAIDPTGLPINADIDSSSETVVPAARSGVEVKFKVKLDTSSAIVVLKNAQGAYLPAGSTGKLEGSDATFLVGYDGQAYIRGLNANNTVVVTLPEGSCRATFSFTFNKSAQQTIGPEVCQ